MLLSLGITTSITIDVFAPYVLLEYLVHLLLLVSLSGSGGPIGPFYYSVQVIPFGFSSVSYAFESMQFLSAARCWNVPGVSVQLTDWLVDPPMICA